ncbi:MAG: hypothetical protein KDD92_08340 [Caldilineaceae bacterium]|nr:hypothetical protein [Caldilineaceae bacterium]
MTPDSKSLHRFNLPSRQVSLRKSRAIAFLLIFAILVQPLLTAAPAAASGGGGGFSAPN